MSYVTEFKCFNNRSTKLRGAAMLDIVKMIYEANREEREKHKREENVYWVSDLVRCPLKRIYEMIYPELSAKEVFTPIFILGNVAHWGIETFLKERLGDKVSIEVEGSREVTLPSGRSVVIKGRADAIIQLNENERIGVEVKTARSDTGIPQQHHKDQARIYNWLFNLEETILLYITPERVTQYEVTDKVTEQEVIARILDTNYPRYSWECGYCPYSVLCPYKKTS